jgi:hypothetical protein
MDKTEKNENRLPGSIRAFFPCTLVSQSLEPSPADCEYFYVKKDGQILHEYCGELELATNKGVKGGSWTRENPPPCYLCTKYKKRMVSDCLGAVGSR